jgi:RNA polymerase sigma factor (sigma-70 family)
MIDVDELYAAHAPILYRYLVRLTGDADLAADGVQEAFVRLLQRRDRSIERAWLFRVATNVVLERLRSDGRHLRLLRSHADRAPMGDATIDPHERVEALERHEQARRALSSLSDKERSAVLMREEGFSHREIATALGTTTGSVGTLIARALLKFSEAIENSPSSVTRST